jgi:cytochrome c oxidase cbb3-type subunit 2
MPAYPWLATNPLEGDDLGAHLATQARLGVPYTDDMIANATSDALAQARPDGDAASGLVDRYGDATTLRRFTDARDVTEMDAVIAYLQVLGQLTQAPYAQKDAS